MLKVIRLLFLNTPVATIAHFIAYNYKNLKKFIKSVNEHVKHNYSDYLEQIGGEGIIVEIDESKFGKRKYNRGHRVEGVWVLGMVERTEERKIVLIPVENRSEDTLVPLIRRYVAPGSIIHTDLWKGYSNLGEWYDHRTVNHSENLWTLLKVSTLTPSREIGSL